MITGFFVATLGVLWNYSLKYHVKPNHHTIVIYDIFGQQLKIDDIRIDAKHEKLHKVIFHNTKNVFHIVISHCLKRYQW